MALRTTVVTTAPWASSQPARHARWPGVAIALLFALWQLPALPGRGTTWDEQETRDAGAWNLRILGQLGTGGSGSEALRALREPPGPDTIGHELPGYCFVGDTLRAALAAALSRRGWSAASSMHLFHGALSALSLYLAYRLGFVLSRSPLASAASAFGLALFPKFLGHSQNNPKDLPALFCFVLAMVCAARVIESGGARRAVRAGLALGLAVTHGPVCLAIPVVLGGAAAVLWRGTIRRRVKEVALLLPTAALAAFAFWPWLWPDPVGRLSEAASRLRSPGLENRLLYLGEVYSWSAVPWHYSLVWLLASTPLVHLVWVGVGAVAALRSRDRRVRALVGLGAVWSATLLVADLLAPLHYDGLRHLLALLPGLALIAGGGVLAARGWLGTRKPVLALLVAASLAQLLWIAVTMRPYEDAYLNQAANAWIDGPAEDVLEVEYWGSSYREGAEWLNRHAEPDAQILLPWTLLANEYLERKGVPPEAVDFYSAAVPQYLMFITRKAFYDPLILRVEAGCVPVYEVRRQRATLLRIYRDPLRCGRAGAGTG